MVYELNITVQPRPPGGISKLLRKCVNSYIAFNFMGNRTQYLLDLFLVLKSLG